MSDLTEIVMNAESYGVDVQFRMVCPFCSGGSRRERCLAAVKKPEGNIAYICHRGMCAMKGYIPGTEAPIVAQRPTNTPPPREINLRPLKLAEKDLISSRWSINPQESSIYDWRWDEVSQRLAMPVYGPLGSLRGFVLRALDDRTPKVLNVRMVESEPFIGWCDRMIHRESTEAYVLVEDMPSAIRVNTIPAFSGVALLGTHISANAMTEIAANREGAKIVLALDEDASVKALEYQRELALLLGRVHVILLDQDIKNMTHKEARICLANAIS